MEKAIENNIGCLSEFEKNNFEIEKRNAKIKANIKKYDTLDIKEEKIEKTDEIELDADLGKTETQSNVVVKMQADGFRFKTFDACAQNLAKKEKEVVNNATNNAVDILLGKSVTKVAKVVDAILKTGVAAATVVSAPVIAVVEGKQAAEQAVKKTTTEAQKAIEKVVAPEKKAEAKKPEAKKQEKKKEEKKKEAKKQEKKKEEKKPAPTKGKEEKKEKSSSVGSGYGSTSTVNVVTGIVDGAGTKSTKTLKVESLIGKRVEVDKIRNSLTVVAEALEHEEQKEKDSANINVNMAGQKLEPTAIPVPGTLEPKITKVAVVSTRRRVSVRTSTSSIDKGLGL